MKKLVVLLCMLTATASLADEIHLKDGSVVRGKLVEIKANEFYRIKTKDGSEFVYTVDKVNKVEFSKEAEKPSETAPGQSWGVIGGGAAPGGFTGSGWDNTRGQVGGGRQYAEDVNVGIGLGKYGLLGADVLLRPSDSIGLEFGVGLWYYSVDTRYGSDSGTEPALGGEVHIYFTPKTEPRQHSLNLGIYHCEAYGNAFGLAYGFESHSDSRFAWDFSIGLVAAPHAEEELERYVGERIDEFTWIPLLLEIGLMF